WAAKNAASTRHRASLVQRGRALYPPGVAHGGHRRCRLYVKTVLSSPWCLSFTQGVAQPVPCTLLGVEHEVKRCRHGLRGGLAGSQSGMSPPSTLNDWPVMFRAPGEARNTAIAAMSSGSFARPMGIAWVRRRSISSRLTPSSWARTRRLASERAVRVTPGQMAFTLMLWVPSCCAAILVRLITAPLLAA